MDSGGHSDFYFSPIRIIDEGGNVLHVIEETAKEYWNFRDFDLTQVYELRDPIEINIPTNKSGGVLTPKNPKKSQKIPKKPNPNLPILV